MSRRLFDKLHDASISHNHYFTQRPDATGKLGLSSYQKVTAALRMFCYGSVADNLNEYIRISETVASGCLRLFADAAIASFGDEYLREPTTTDIQRHADINKARGFPGMFGSLDCTHWEWKNCPYSWKGQYQDRDGRCSMVMEAIATYDLWIWHAFVGLPGSNNDLNILGRSPLIVDWLNGSARRYEHMINETEYKSCYLLCDGIYPEWSVFVKTISNPQTEKESYFAKRQEGIRKDMERCFGVLKGRFGILSRPARGWKELELRRIWKAALIMHNMIIDDERGDCDALKDPSFDSAVVLSTANTAQRFDRYLLQISYLRDSRMHSAIQQDLIDHLWKAKVHRRRHYILDSEEEKDA